MDAVQDMPTNSIAGDQMAEELRNDTQSVGLVAMDCVVIFSEHAFEKLLPESVELAKTFTDQAEELVVRTFLTATLDDHAGQFVFTPSGKVDAHKLVACFFKATRRHYRQVDRTAQVDKISVRLILDLHLFFSLVLASVFVACILVVFVVFVLTSRLFTQNLSLELPIRFLVCLPFRIILEDVRAFLRIQLILQARRVCNLVLLFHKIQLFFQCGIVLVLVFPNLEQHFDHVLDSLVDIRFMQNAPELIIHSKCNLRVHFFHVLSHLLGQSNSNLHTVVCRLVQE